MDQTENRRVEQRIDIKDNVYVLLDTRPQIMGQMVDISSIGLAFTFVDLESASEHLVERARLRLDLFTGGRGYFLRNLPCRVISKTDQQTPDTGSNIRIKRVGIAFENLSLADQVKINTFVRYHLSEDKLCEYTLPAVP